MRCSILSFLDRAGPSFPIAGSCSRAPCEDGEMLGSRSGMSVAFCFGTSAQDPPPSHLGGNEE